LARHNIPLFHCFSTFVTSLPPRTQRPSHHVQQTVFFFQRDCFFSKKVFHWLLFSVPLSDMVGGTLFSSHNSICLSFFYTLIFLRSSQPPATKGITPFQKHLDLFFFPSCSPQLVFFTLCVFSFGPFSYFLFSPLFFPSIPHP